MTRIKEIKPVLNSAGSLKPLQEACSWLCPHHNVYRDISQPALLWHFLHPDERQAAANYIYLRSLAVTSSASTGQPCQLHLKQFNQSLRKLCCPWRTERFCKNSLDDSKGRGRLKCWGTITLQGLRQQESPLLRNCFDGREKTFKKATGSPKVRGKSISFKETSPQKKEKRKRMILLQMTPN